MTISASSIGLFSVLVNLITLCLVIRNIMKEVGKPSVFSLVMSPCTSSDSATSASNQGGPSSRRRSQSLTFMGEKVLKKSSSSANPALTHKGTVFINRVVIAGIVLNSLAAAAGLFKTSSFSKWMTLVAVQCWLCYGVLSHFFFSWIKFLLKVQAIDEALIQTIRITGFAICFLLNSIISSLFVFGLHTSAQNLCKHTYLLWEFFWIVCICVMLITAIFSAYKTVNLLEVDFKSNSQVEVKKIQRKTVFFSLLCVLVLCTFVTAVTFNVSDLYCESERSAPVFNLSVFVQYATSLSWMLTVGFNWISSSKSSAASAAGVNVVQVESSVSRRPTAVIDIPKDYINGTAAV